MKLKTILLSTFIVMSLLACNKKEASEAKDIDTSVEKIEEDKELFKVTLNAIVTKDDTFQLYYMEDDSKPYDEKNSIYVDVKGSTSPQDIIFRLPKDELPYFLRLDFGINKNQSEITVKNFKIDYFDKTLEFKDGLFFNYFVVNEDTMKKDTLKSSVIPFVLKDGGYDPMSYSELGLEKEIQKLVR